MAALLLPDLRLHLLQFVETSRSYVVTLTALEHYQPAELLVVASQHEDVATGLNDATRRLQQVALPRAFFDDTKVPSVLPPSAEFCSACGRALLRAVFYSICAWAQRNRCVAANTMVA
jgi:hypothetical protein